MKRQAWRCILLVGCCLTVGPVRELPAAENGEVDYFRKQVRPLLEKHCYECHSHASGKAKGGLVLDSKAGWQTGGDSGPAVVPGDVEASPLIRAVRHVDDQLKMPPKQKLPAKDVAVLEKWIQMGAPDPRASAVAATRRTMDVEEGKQHWAYQPVKPHPIPRSAVATGVGNEIDAFLTTKRQAAGLKASPQAEARMLIRRLYVVMLGIPPTYEEAEAFAADASPDAYARLVDRVLARPEYGQRWGRHWLDVARYADTIEQSVDGERRIPFAHTYRDYIIDALNSDRTYDRMILEQVAADRMEDGDLRALGFLTVGRQFRSNADGPVLVIDDRIDVVGRGFMGMTLACSRCHDHKFDPIPTADYYSLYGILGSVEEPIDLPAIGPVPKDSPAVQAYMDKRAELLKAWVAHVDACFESSNRHFREMATEYLRYVVRSSPNHRTTEGYVPLDTPTGLLFYQAPPRWEALLRKSREEREPFFKFWHQCMEVPRADFAKSVPKLMEKMLATPGEHHAWVAQAFGAKPPGDMLQVAETYGELIKKALASTEPEGRGVVQLVYGPASPVPPADREEIAEDIPRFLTEKRLVHRREGEAGTAILTKLSALEATAPVERAMAVRATARPMEPRVLVRGDMKRPGTAVPRRFLSVLASVDAENYRDDGRLQLARAIASPKNPLTARVVVNRVWQHHFGVGLVATSDDFGTMGEKPVHPELLDYLAGWFMQHDWSLKALHRFILMSGAWQQASIPHEKGLAVDPTNRLLWRMSPRRLEFEPLRDALLHTSGNLDTSHGGRSAPLTDANRRRAVYGYTDRFRIPALLRNFDVANPDTSISRRSETLVPLQALYLLNNPFVRKQAEAVLKRAEVAMAADVKGRVRAIFRVVLSRDPEQEEVDASLSYVQGASLDAAGSHQWTSLVQALLLSNEFVFVD